MPGGSISVPKEGTRAPTFSLLSHLGEKVRLSSLLGQPVVLYFYPKDNTSGCTTQAKEFRDQMQAIEKLGAKVIGVSPDSPESHRKFIDKHSLNFTLLADVEHAVAEKYGIWVEKHMYGRKYWGVRRTTFLITVEGKIHKVWDKVKPKGHAAEVLKALDTI